ncbi:hypothetical protein BCV70DRAFT_202414 [Testicularia cyperi]|uniref:Uncharacterized protein n=1 Tax=Testicularia cyperi TaxID=1882483 RepID=A0A317XI52_9BASI|nr:hypothetical protein BCV70DRAFT_202414 [Testicularia cyperi]
MAASFNPLALLAERTCGPIYNAIDTGNNVLAVRHADKILASQPDLALAMALKSLALVRSGKHADANAVCDKLIARGLRKGEDGALTPLTWTLGRLGRRADEVAILEVAVKNNPHDEELARQTFMAFFKSQLYQKAQQHALKMYKTFGGKAKKGRLVDEYFWWSIQSYLLLSRDPKASGAALALPLSQRMIEKQIESKPLTLNDEEALWLQLQVLIKQGKKEDAFALLVEPESIGDTLCDRNLSLEFQRTDLAKELQKWPIVEQHAKAKIQAGSTNWAHFLAYLEAAGKIGPESLAGADELLITMVSSGAGRKDRSVRLAELELWRRRAEVGSTLDSGKDLLALTLAYFDQFATKACCHEDLLPYLALLSVQQRLELSSQLETRRKTPIKTENDLRVTINIAKISRAVQSATSAVTADSEARLAKSLLQSYAEGLSIGRDLPETEMQPADDLALMAAQALVSAYDISGHVPTYLLQTITLLELALARSKKGYQLRMLLIRCCVLAGAFDRAAIHYGLIGIKSIQLDTLSYLISDRTAAFSPLPPSLQGSASADDGLSKLLIRHLSAAQHVYAENRQSTPEMIAKAFEHGIYSRVEEFVDFADMVDRSVQRQVLRLEEARAHLHNRRNFATLQERQSFQQGIESKAKAVLEDLGKGLFDQRDFGVLVSYAPIDRPDRDVELLTRPGPRQREAWVRCFASLLSADAGELATEDLAELGEVERQVVQLVNTYKQSQSQSQSSGDAQPLASFLETAKESTRKMVQGFTSTPGSGTPLARPIDLIQSVALSLEACYLIQPRLAKTADLSNSKTHLAEMATLVNHLSRTSMLPTSTSTSDDKDVIQDGLRALGNDQVAQLLITTQDNIAKSCKKVLNNLRDALRDAL